MFRGAAIAFVVSMLLTTVATLMSTGAVHAQQGPQHVFSGYVSFHRQPLNDGFVKVTIGPGFGLQPAVQEVAYEAVRQGRYKIAIQDPTRGNMWAKTNPGSAVMLKFSVIHQGREYQRSREVRLEPGKVTELNFDIEGWLWHQATPQRVGAQEDQRRRDQNDGDRARQLEEDQRRMDQNDQDRARRMEMDDQRMEMERQRMEMEEKMRRKIKKVKEELFGDAKGWINSAKALQIFSRDEVAHFPMPVSARLVSSGLTATGRPVTPFGSTPHRQTKPAGRPRRPRRKKRRRR